MEGGSYGVSQALLKRRMYTVELPLQSLLNRMTPKNQFNCLREF